MRKILTALFFTLICTTASHASAKVTCNAHGAVVALTDGTVYYLGKSCDAAQKGGGSGKWWLAASFFAVEIDGQARRLPIEVGCDLPFCSP